MCKSSTRHSTTEDNEQGFATGWLEERFRRWREQALATSAGRHDDLDIVIASDLNRAVETARIAFGDSDIPVRLDWRLRECNYGAMNGMPRSQLDTERRLRLDEAFPGGESWRSAVERVGSVLDELVADRPGQRVLLIGHVATRWALDHFVHGRPLEDLVDAPFTWQRGWEYTLAA